MSKTLFTDGDPSLGILGTIVRALFLNKIFSHRHDGADEDGSAPINYAADTYNLRNEGQNKDGHE